MLDRVYLNNTRSLKKHYSRINKTCFSRKTNFTIEIEFSFQNFISQEVNWQFFNGFLCSPLNNKDPNTDPSGTPSNSSVKLLQAELIFDL